MNGNFSLAPRHILNAIAALAGIGLLLALAFVLNVLFASRSQQLPQEEQADASIIQPPQAINSHAQTRCRTSEPADEPGTMTILVYLTCNGRLQPVTRRVPEVRETEAVLHIVLEELLEGPTEEERGSGFISWFSGDTTAMLNDVSISDEGVAIVDFDDFSHIIPNASTSAGSALLLSQLNGTVFQFDNIEAIIYQFDESCKAFWYWLQSTCHPVPRSFWEEHQIP